MFCVLEGSGDEGSGDEGSGDEGSGDEGSGEAPPSEYSVKPHLVSILGHYMKRVCSGWRRLDKKKDNRGGSDGSNSRGTGGLK